jgi:NTE family protein
MTNDTSKSMLTQYLFCGLSLVTASIPAFAQFQDGNSHAQPHKHDTTINAPVSTSIASSKVVASQKTRPKIALVLSGGGARGFAHIGVLRVLKEMRIPVDFVVGTSMGAVVGGAYAAGSPVEELEDIVRKTSWESVLADRPARDTLDFRRREEDLLLPSRIELSLSSSGLSLPPSAAGNASLEQALTRLLPKTSRDEKINQLAIPFRSVASDLVTGELVEMVDTPLLATMRASLAVPGMFAPVHLNNRVLVDGGLVRNLPIDIAHNMGADIVIAINVGTPLAKEKELGSAISVAQQMIQILTEQNVQRSKKEIRSTDILIEPDLSGIDFLDFSEHHNAMLAGDIATRQLDSKLSHLSLSEQDYLAFDQQRRVPLKEAPHGFPISSIKITGNKSINPEILLAQSDLKIGAPASESSLQQARKNLYGRGDLDHVETRLKEVDGKSEVTILAQEAEWTKNRIRLGLELSSDFRSSSNFIISGMHVASSMNAWGGEFRNIAKIGSTRQIGTQFYQPLGINSPWYVAPSYQYGASSIDSFEEGRKLARLNYSINNLSFSLGRKISNWGDLSFNFYQEKGNSKITIPQDNEPLTILKGKTHELRFRLDTLDNLGAPTRGNFLTASLSNSKCGYPNCEYLANFSFIGLTAFSSGKTATHFYAEWAKSQDDIAPLSLGGFLRLSGMETGSLSNKTIGFLRMVESQRIGSMPAALGGAIRLGYSLEIGGGFKANENIKFSQLKRSGSVFLSFDTRFGPLYTAYGKTWRGDSTFYLFLGPIW